ncbi:bifunctional adenosylcobinamide kinase/adenosylcobinamide-phosphate guanylyltransferase [Sphingobium sp. AN558]|uniref:bifunctional adenosylcobinamide kinase/adenosylcobinamide-phosphate guanylyltransferase n=1 Tax=Sphingobium sp. AN558 TaxID=3133442 RepID=UPI0030C4337D
MTVASSLLVLGGARSGKSGYAQGRAEALEGNLVFVATAQAFDEEMADRIALHRADRGPRWTTAEAPVDLASIIDRHSQPHNVLLIDCLTLWTSNLLLADQDIIVATELLVSATTRAPGPLIFVANEVGLGIVPDNPLARRFRDEAGRVNQAIAAAVDEVTFVAAGLPLRLK